MKKLLLLLTIFILTMAVGIAPAALPVTPSSPGSWIIDGISESSLGGSGSGDFVLGPSTPPAGIGSVSMSTTANGGVALFNYYTHLGMPLADIEVLQYSTYADTGKTARPNFQINVDYYCDQESWDGRLVYIPPSADVLDSTWQTWDAKNGLWVASSSSISNEDETGTDTLSFSMNGGTPISMTDLLALYPNACIHSTYGGFGAKIGTYSSADSGSVDMIILNREIYNFEPDGDDNEVPEFGLIAGLTVLGLAGLFIYKKRN